MVLPSCSVSLKRLAYCKVNTLVGLDLNWSLRICFWRSGDSLPKAKAFLKLCRSAVVEGRFLAGEWGRRNLRGLGLEPCYWLLLRELL